MALGFSVWGRNPKTGLLAVVLPCVTLSRSPLFLGPQFLHLLQEGVDGPAHCSGPGRWEARASGEE